MDKIQQAYEMGLRIRYKGWDITFWIKKHSETEVIDESGFVWDGGWAFDNNPEKWEIWHEDEPLFKEPTKPIKPTETLPENLIINGIKYTRNDN
jgi:hypothetical protein